MEVCNDTTLSIVVPTEGDRRCVVYAGEVCNGTTANIGDSLALSGFLKRRRKPPKSTKKSGPGRAVRRHALQRLGPPQP